MIINAEDVVLRFKKIWMGTILLRVLQLKKIDFISKNSNLIESNGNESILQDQIMLLHNIYENNIKNIHEFWQRFCKQWNRNVKERMKNYIENPDAKKTIYLGKYNK